MLPVRPAYLLNVDVAPTELLANVPCAPIKIWLLRRPVSVWWTSLETKEWDAIPTEQQEHKDYPFHPPT
jgi:hypothetical protein